MRCDLVIVITILYLALCGASFVQMARILVNWHSVWGFHFPFLLLCFAFGVLRVAFFVYNQASSELLTSFLFWSPINVQFAAFTLVVVYHANVLYKRTWEDIRKTVYCVYLLVNMLTLIVTCSILLTCTAMTTERERKYHLCLAIQFLLLTIAYCGCGQLLSHVPRSSMSVEKPQIVSTTRVAAVVFATRAAYNCLAAMDIFSLEFGPTSKPLPLLNVYVFTCIVLWEIVPTVVVLWLFRDIPKAKFPLGFHHLRAWCCPCLPNAQRHDEQRIVQDESAPTGYGSRDHGRGLDRSPRPSMADEEAEEMLAVLDAEYNTWTSYEPSSRALEGRNSVIKHM
jgi:hypothetical protein